MPPAEWHLQKRIHLKKHEKSLAEPMFRCVDHDRNRLRIFLPWVDVTKSVADELSYIEQIGKCWTEYSCFDYGIFLSSEEKYLGNINIHNIDWENSVCELGYWIFGDYEGHGYITEALKALEKETFNLGFNRIEIRCSSINTRSTMVAKRCGYVWEGTLRQNVLMYGNFHDTLIFAKLCNPNS